jgi:hypothetical protein
LEPLLPPSLRDAIAFPDQLTPPALQSSLSPSRKPSSRTDACGGASDGLHHQQQPAGNFADADISSPLRSFVPKPWVSPQRLIDKRLFDDLVTYDPSCLELDAAQAEDNHAAPAASHGCRKSGSQLAASQCEAAAPHSSKDDMPRAQQQQQQYNVGCRGPLGGRDLIAPLVEVQDLNAEYRKGLMGVVRAAEAHNAAQLKAFQATKAALGLDVPLSPLPPPHA